MEGITLLIVVSAAIGGIFILITALSYLYGLKGIKAKTAGNGQHGTARWARMAAESGQPTEGARHCGWLSIQKENDNGTCGYR